MISHWEMLLYVNYTTIFIQIKDERQRDWWYDTEVGEIKQKIDCFSEIIFLADFHVSDK